MSLSGFLKPCSRTEVTIPLSPEEMAKLPRAKEGDIVLFTAGPGEDYHLILRTRSLSPDGLTASAAGYLSANLPGSDLAPFEPRTGVRRGLSVPDGNIYLNEQVISILARLQSTKPYADYLRDSYLGTPS